MEVSCTGCGKKYRIDDGKLPPVGKAVIKCPGCGNRIEIRISERNETASSEPASAPMGHGTGPEVSSQGGTDTQYGQGDRCRDARAGSQSQGEDPGMEFFEPGTKTALVFCPDYEAMAQIEKGLKADGYQIRQVSGAGDVQSRFRYHIYDLLILYQSGPEPDDRLSGILSWINSVNMDIRRRVLVVHISMNGNRFDSMQAFSLGVDATLSPLNIAKLPEVLDKVTREREAMYKIFNECLARVKEEVF